MSEIDPMVVFLYRLLLDGGTVLSQKTKHNDPNVFILEVKPNPSFTGHELRDKYGKGYGPYTIMLGQRVRDYYQEFYDQL